MRVLSLNCGSSSVKYRLYDYAKKETLATGVVERVGIGKSYMNQAGLGREPIKFDHDCGNHKDAIKLIIDTLLDPKIGVVDNLKEISRRRPPRRAWRREVHLFGADRRAMSWMPSKRCSTWRRCTTRPTSTGIEAAQALLPTIPHVAIFDTAFHQTMPDQAYIYALPYEWYEKYSVRRYGFHGTSHLYVAKRAAVLLGKDPAETATSSPAHRQRRLAMAPSRTASPSTPPWA